MGCESVISLVLTFLFLLSVGLTRVVLNIITPEIYRAKVEVAWEVVLVICGISVWWNVIHNWLYPKKEIKQ